MFHTPPILHLPSPPSLHSYFVIFNICEASNPCRFRFKSDSFFERGMACSSDGGMAQWQLGTSNLSALIFIHLPSLLSAYWLLTKKRRAKDTKGRGRQAFLGSFVFPFAPAKQGLEQELCAFSCASKCVFCLRWPPLLGKTVWPSGLRRWLQAPVRKGVGSNPTAVM